MRIVLYEPSGRGGVCHYTHQLGEHLVRAGVDVTLITTEDYELKHLEHHFKLDYLFSRSWLTLVRQRITDFRQTRRDRDNPDHRDLPSIEHIATNRENKGRRKGFTVSRRLRIRLLHMRALSRMVRRRPDVVHFQWLVNRAQDRKLIKLLRLLGIPAIYTAHDVEPHTSASERDVLELQRLYESVSKIIVHAESNKRELLSRFRVEPSKVVVIPHGSYDFLCVPGPLTKEAARRVIGVPEGKKVILFFGLIKRYKGLEFLVDAFRQVREGMEDAFLLIVGDIFAADAESHRYYSELIDGLRDREDVLCVATYVPLETVGYYLAASDVVVLPYTRTYQSGVLLAAYAAGRPVVVTDTGGLSEAVEEGRTGVVVPPRDVKALATGIISLLADPKRRKAMGEHAKYLAATMYSWDTVASRTIAVYRSIAAESGNLLTSPVDGLPAPPIRQSEDGNATMSSTPSSEKNA